MTISELLCFYGTCCGQLWWVYTIVRVEAYHWEIQVLIGSFIVLIFSVLLQALFDIGHFSYSKNVLLLLSVACRGDGWQESSCNRRKGAVMFLKYAKVRKKSFPQSTMYHDYICWNYFCPFYSIVYSKLLLQN